MHVTKIDLAPPKTKPRRWASLTLGAEYLGISEKTLRRMISSGLVSGYRCGPRLVRVDLNELDAIAAPIPVVGAVGA